MLTETLVSDLHKLNRTDKLRAVQLLVSDLALEEEFGFIPGAQYEVWSPQITAEGASILLEVLNEAKREDATDKLE